MSSTLERSVLITNLSRKATQQNLVDFFTFCGGIESLVIEEGSPFNSAIVVFDSVSAAKTASVVSSALIVDAPIRVQLRSAAVSSGSNSSAPSSRDVPPPAENYQSSESEGSQVKPGFLARSIGTAYCAWKTLDFTYGVSSKAKAAATSVKTSIDKFDQENHISATIKVTVRPLLFAAYPSPCSRTRSTPSTPNSEFPRNLRMPLAQWYRRSMKSAQKLKKLPPSRPQPPP